MILSLNHQQRLNLIALMGAQRVNLSEMRSFWMMQDRFDLSEEEKQAIGYSVATTSDGMEIPRWDQEKSTHLGLRDFEVSEAEAQRLRKLIDEWPHFITGVDRRWLSPLLAQLPEVPQVNGGAAALRM